MDVLTPHSLDAALRLKAEQPEAWPIQGGTDVMVALNFDHGRPPALLNLNEVPELRGWSRENGSLRLGSGLTYMEIERGELREVLPALAEASRTVGSPQIRNRGTIGGNLGTSSPAGDGLPPLFASAAEVELASTSGTRRVPIAEFVTGPKRNGMAPDELIAAYTLPAAAGPQQFAKIGTRNAMVIAVCSLALALWPDERRVTACIGSAGPTPIPATDAEAFIAGVLDEQGLWESRAPISESALTRFGELVELAARPINDVRGTAAYRHHALRVLGRRTLTWAWRDYRAETARCA